MPLDPVQRLLDLYPRIFRACHTSHVHDPVAGQDLSRHQASILSHLDDVEPTTVTELAEHMGVTVSTMSLAVKRLHLQGYVARERDPEDGRVVNLRLTDAGVRVRDSQTVLDPGRVRLLLDRLSADEREAGLRGLGILARAADQVEAGAPGHSRDESSRRREIV